MVDLNLRFSRLITTIYFSFSPPPDIWMSRVRLENKSSTLSWSFHIQSIKEVWRWSNIPLLHETRGITKCNEGGPLWRRMLNRWIISDNIRKNVLCQLRNKINNFNTFLFKDFSIDESQAFSNSEYG